MYWAALIGGATYYYFDSLLYSLKLSNLKGEYVFITGCDSGFGQELVMYLDKLKFNVFAGCLTQDGAKSLKDRVSERVHVVQLDVTRPKTIQKAVEQVKEHLPEDKGLWALVNNAGIVGMWAHSELASKEDFQKVLDINLLGMIEVTRSFLPLVRKSQGRIINCSSSGGRTAVKGAPYVVSKFGIEGYSDLLRREVYNQGIRVSIVEPGGHKTKILDGVVENVREAFERSDPEVKSVYGDDYMERYEDMIKTAQKKEDPSCDPVIDAYIHAITARYPRTRYPVGKAATYFTILLSYFPDWLSDWVIVRGMGKLYECNRPT